MSRDWKQIAQTEKKLAEHWEARYTEEQERTANIIADLLFAFINKDEKHPHDFEIKAFENALNVLCKNYDQIKYNPRLFEDHLERMREDSGNE